MLPGHIETDQLETLQWVEAHRQVIDEELGITALELEHGRRKFELEMGSLGAIEVIDTPATALTPSEWDIISLARNSYARMWGGNGTMEKIKEDPFDGRPPYHQLYDTTHQIATFRSLDGRAKYLTNRKVAFNPSCGKEPNVYDDIRFWRVSDQHGNNSYPLREAFERYFEAQPHQHPDTNITWKIAAISRTGTYPYVLTEHDEQERDKTATAWAMMQIAATHQDTHELWVCQLCEEFPQKVLSVKDSNGRRIMLDFTRTQEILRLPPGQRLKLNRDDPYVQAHILRFPGYWTNNRDLSQFFQTLAQERLLGPVDFSSASTALLESEERVLLNPDSTELLQGVIRGSVHAGDRSKLFDLFTQPRFCKYLIPLLNRRGNINTRLTGDELRSRLLNKVGDGPFSSTLIPARWRESARNLLKAAKAKYETKQQISTGSFAYSLLEA